MEERKPSKFCLKRNMELDRISHLPSDVIEQILSRLPIKEAVKTSGLSTKWRYRWAMLPHIGFDDHCFSNQNHTTFVNIVDQVLLLHIGPMHSFHHFRRVLPTGDVDRWILHLSRNAIKDIIVEIWGGITNNYRMPSSLFSCQDLVKLRLCNCVLKPPSTFKGFKSLKRLIIREVTLAQDVFDNLIMSCPLLERLSVIVCDGFTNLNINASNLQVFEFGGSFENVNLEKTLNLAEVCINLVDLDLEWLPASSSHLVKFFVHLPHIRRLAIESYFLQYLADGALPETLPKPCLYLNFLSITIHLCYPEEVSTAKCLLRSSPALQELEVLFQDSDAIVLV